MEQETLLWWGQWATTPRKPHHPRGKQEKRYSVLCGVAKLYHFTRQLGYIRFYNTVEKDVSVPPVRSVAGGRD